MLRNASIRTRVLAIVAIPVLFLVIVASGLVAGSVRTARGAEQLSRVAATEGAALSLVSALDDEQLLSVQVRGGDSGARAALGAARAVTDPRLASEGAALAEVDPTKLDPQVRRALDAALSAGRRVRALRSQVDAGAVTAAATTTAYDGILADQVELPGRLASAVHDPKTADALRAATSVSRLSQLLVSERDLGQSALSDGNVSADERLTLAGVQAQEASERADATTLAASAGVRVPAVSAELVAARTAALGGASGGRSTLQSAAWGDVVSADIARLAAPREALRTAAIDGVDRQANAARRTAWLTALAALAAVLIPLAIALVVARGLTEPLRALTAAAGTVRQRLPRLVAVAHGASSPAGRGPGEPGSALRPDVELPVLDVRSSDEVGRLAAAFNEVNATSLAVAREQAALREAISTTFTTLARRDQALLARQLAFIDDLERAEDDPKVLDDLFVLDHLATRMRRNAESLLVLAGLEGGRRLRGPMNLSDVVRTATSEVEDYKRVQLQLEADPPVLGHLALSAAHLLAELLENALTASDPATSVVVAAAPAADGGVVVTVTDDGLGMSTEQRERAASRIADPSATAALGASELGFFVVGRLARRLGAKITPQAGRERGTAVEVVLPVTALASPAVSQLLLTPQTVPAVPAEPAAPAQAVAAGAATAGSAAVASVASAGATIAPASHAMTAPAVKRLKGIVAGFRARRVPGASTSPAGPAIVTPAPAVAAPATTVPAPAAAAGLAASAGSSGSGQPRAISTALGDKVGALTAAAAPGSTGLDAHAYTPLRTTSSAAAPLPPRTANKNSNLKPFTPQPGEAQPQTRRERRAVETGRMAAVVAKAPPSGAATPTTEAAVGYQPARVAAEPPATLARRERRPEGVTVPASPAGATPVWVTPPGGLRAVPEADAPRRRAPSEVRNLLAGYQSGVTRARRTGVKPATAGARSGGPPSDQPDAEERS